MRQQRKLRADSLEDMTMLATCVLTTPASQRPSLIAVVHDLGLMRFSGTLRPLLWLIRTLKGRAGLVAFFTHLQTRSPADLDEMIQQTAKHILQGDDKEDRSSVGGFSQREVEMLQTSVSFSF